MRKILRISMLCSLTALAGCGGSGAQTSTQAGDSPASSTSPAPEPSPGSQVRALESTGQLPRLDRTPTLGGVDANVNGVRDDIERWVQQLDLTPAQKRATLQLAESTQALILADLADDAALQSVSETSSDAVACLFDSIPDAEFATSLSRQTEAFTANTEQRARRYLAFNARRGGTTTRMLSTNTCK